MKGAADSDDVLKINNQEQLLRYPEQAQELIDFLLQQKEQGIKWAVYDTDHPISSKWEIACFSNEFDAAEYARDNRIILYWQEAVPIENLLFSLRKFETSLTRESIPIRTHMMNVNNLENLKKEMKELRFDKKLSTEMEKNMQKELPEFQLKHHVPADKGTVDFTLHFKKSAQSDFYYFNKYDVSLNQAKPLEEGQKYLVISQGENDKPVFRKFDSPYEAIAYFKDQKGDSELAAGKNPEYRTPLAAMESGKINYVHKDFKKTFFTPPVMQTFYIEKGRGFTAEQAASLIQGRSVYRDDLLNLAGMPYKAWIKLDFDRPKDRHNNFNTNQYHDPSYGFNLEKTLEKYKIKELDNPAEKQSLIQSLQNGNRPAITTEKEGQEVKLHIEAVPRYGNVNFFTGNGRPEKREQFEKVQKEKPESSISKRKNKEKVHAGSKGMRV